MRKIFLMGEIDEHRTPHANVPQEIPIGRVRLIVLLPDEEDASAAWTEGVARAWAADLANEPDDVYSLDDGQPIASSREEWRSRDSGTTLGSCAVRPFSRG